MRTVGRHYGATGHREGGQGLYGIRSHPTCRLVFESAVTASGRWFPAGDYECRKFAGGGVGFGVSRGKGVSNTTVGSGSLRGPLMMAVPVGGWW